MKGVREPKQQRGIKTKKQIKKTAYRVFARKGVHGTTAREIAQKAGVSNGTFYAYFINKKALLLEMLEDYLEVHFRTIWRSLDVFDHAELDREKIRTIIDNVFEAYEISPDFHRQTHALRYSDPDIKRIFDREREREIDQIQNIIEKNRQRLPHITSAQAAAMVIHNAVENVALTAKIMGSSLSEGQLADSLADMIAGYALGTNTDAANYL